MEASLLPVQIHPSVRVGPGFRRSEWTAAWVSACGNGALLGGLSRGRLVGSEVPLGLTVRRLRLAYTRGVHGLLVDCGSGATAVRRGRFRPFVELG